MKPRKISCDVLILFRSLRFGAQRSCWYISAGRHVASLEKWTLDEPVLEFPLHCRQVGWGSTALGALSPREACSVSLGLAPLPVGFPACFPACVITVRPLTACRTQSHSAFFAKPQVMQTYLSLPFMPCRLSAPLPYAPPALSLFVCNYVTGC